MKEELINYETAKLAKEKGFTVETKYRYYNCMAYEEMQYGHGKYHDDELGYETIEEKLEWLRDSKPNRPVKEDFPAPTQSLLQKWLREVHKIDIYVIGYGFGYYSQLNNVSPGNQEEVKYVDRRWNMPPDYKNGEYKNYEEALERGLQEALKMI